MGNKLLRDRQKRASSALRCRSVRIAAPMRAKVWLSTKSSHSPHLPVSCALTNERVSPTRSGFNDTGLTATTSYSYRVRAADAAGNLSGYSSVASATTLGSAAQIYYIHPDHLNTPRLIANQAGTAVWRWDQGEPFGNDVPNNNPSGAGAFDFPLRFPGQYFDRETNLAYNLKRDYDPATSRYVESDPIGLRGGINTYTYVQANPISFADPRGLDNPGMGPYGPPWSAPEPTDAGTRCRLRWAIGGAFIGGGVGFVFGNRNPVLTIAGACLGFVAGTGLGDWQCDN